MTTNQIKHGLKVFLFLTGVLLLTIGIWVISVGLENGGFMRRRKLVEITIAEGVIFGGLLVGVYIIVNLLKGRTRTKWETDEQKEIQKRNRNNGN
jgi:type VI protein secretion system component VasK